MWERTTGKHFIIGKHKDEVRSVAISVDNKFVISAAGDKNI